MRTDEASTTDPVCSVVAGVTARAGYMMGGHIDRTWSADDAIAWEGLLESTRRFRRGAETALEEAHGLSISMLGLMGRLAQAPGRMLRLTDLAEAMGLSLSRVSRVVDHLESDGLVERAPCPEDARATYVVLTDAGRTRTAAAQETIFTFVDTGFRQRLSESERATLARIFTRLISEPDAG